MDNLVQLLDGLGLTADDALKAVEKLTSQIPKTGGAGGAKTPSTPPPPPPTPAGTDFVTEALAAANRPVTLWQLAYLLVAGGLLWRIFVKKQRAGLGCLCGVHKSHRQRRG